jgi:hypothetical protein
MKPYIALPAQAAFTTTNPVVAVDIGYSASRPSCGLAWSGGSQALEFGAAITRTTELLRDFDWTAVLVIEAVLSTFHQENGNPDIRGDFELGRGWYYGAGVLSFAAALRFLACLADHHAAGPPLSLAEAFLSNKDTPTGHAVDAECIRDNFWGTQPALLRPGVEAASTLIEGVPSVRVFRLGAGPLGRQRKMR